MEQVPLAFPFDDGMVGCPAYYRGEDDSLVCERAVNVVADCIAKEMAVAC